MGIKFIYDNANSFSSLNDRIKPVRIIMNELHEPTNGQNIVMLNGRYTPGSGELEVLLNGIPQRLNIDYYEISENSIQFIDPLESSDIVQCIVRGSYVVQKRQTFILEEDTQLIVLRQPYYVGSDSVMVFVNGDLLIKDVDYYEEDEYTIRFERSYPRKTRIVIHEVR